MKIKAVDVSVDQAALTNAGGLSPTDYVARLAERLRKVYPGAAVSVRLGPADRYAVDGDPADAEAGWVRAAAQVVFNEMCAEGGD